MEKRIRRNYDENFKTKVVLEALKEHKTLAQLCSEFELHATQIGDWKKQVVSGIPSLFAGKKILVSEQEKEELTAPLYQQIGQLKRGGPCRGIGFLKKKIAEESIGLSLVKRKKMIEANHSDLSIGRQCDLLGLSRSSYYYQPCGESVANLVLMKEIDVLYTKHPFYGPRRIAINLPNKYQPINVKKVRRLMKLMGIEAIYSKPNLSKPDSEHKIFPYLLRGKKIEKVNQVWSTDITARDFYDSNKRVCIIFVIFFTLLG